MLMNARKVVKKMEHGQAFVLLVLVGKNNHKKPLAINFLYHICLVRLLFFAILLHQARLLTVTALSINSDSTKNNRIDNDPSLSF